MGRRRHNSRRSVAPQPIAPSAVTASAFVLGGDDSMTKQLVIQPNEPQQEAWQFYRSLGELQFAVGIWLANCVSRCRLVAAEIMPGGGEPVPIEDGPYTELVTSLAGGVGGQAAMMKKFAVHLSVPGESYLVGEDTTGSGNPELFNWRVYSSSELRVSKRNPITYQVMEYNQQWQQLTGDYIVVRVWNPDDEISWRPASTVQSALPILREVDYWNRYIIAVLLSRLAMNGILLIPDDVTFPVDERFRDHADPFVAQLIDTASKAIKNPGSAAAAIPIPLKVPPDSVEKFKHLTFATDVGDHVQEHRQAALTRLATSMNMPAEVLTGLHNMNHWGQWQLEESAIKIHIAPLVEIICYGLTTGYLRPMAKAAGLDVNAGPNGGRVVIWFDAGELTQQPDKSGEAQAVSDRGAMTDEALMKASGFEDEDIPTMDEFKQIALKRIAMAGGADALLALSKLTGDDSLVPPTPAPVAPPEGPPSSSPGTEPGPAGSQPTDQGPPNTRGAPVPSTAQPHAIETRVNGHAVVVGVGE